MYLVLLCLCVCVYACVLRVTAGQKWIILVLTIYLHTHMHLTMNRISTVGCVCVCMFVLFWTKPLYWTDRYYSFIESNELFAVYVWCIYVGFLEIKECVHSENRMICLCVYLSNECWKWSLNLLFFWFVSFYVFWKIGPNDEKPIFNWNLS